ncbi:hypothetical protein [Streptomyces sp. NBC_00996]|uniref:hypothetical protein n=1 Tax=Streptomyces sp. NBC_00996 TaxID=2903710 RepID=UPI00386D45FD|nr:hypothetical protein OG390_17255 [Streptomyces sp. NBC_00996]
MEKQCGGCGKSFDAQRKTAKYCSDRCRMRAHRRPADSERTGSVTSPAPAERQNTDSLTDAVRAELKAAGRLDSAAGRVVLALARRIDAGGRESGSSLASLAKEFRAALGEALKGVETASDPVDELRARRDRKRSG